MADLQKVLVPAFLSREGVVSRQGGMKVCEVVYCLEGTMGSLVSDQSAGWSICVTRDPDLSSTLSSYVCEPYLLARSSFNFSSSPVMPKNAPDTYTYAS